jgi:hypothetical protein
LKIVGILRIYRNFGGIFRLIESLGFSGILEIVDVGKV